MRKADVDGPICPVTGRTIAEELHAAVHLLSTAAPYARDDVRYSQQEWRAYCDGYYRALAQAGAVMDLAMTRRRTRVKGAYADRPRTEIRKDAPRRAGAIASDGPRRARADRGDAPADVHTRRSRGGHGDR
jgi:hypothetical protein